MLQLTGVDLIAAERQQHLTSLGWTADNDDQYLAGELVVAAAAYALHDTILRGAVTWPWDDYDFKPTTAIRDLTKAGALIAAEIDRLQRLESNTAS